MQRVLSHHLSSLISILPLYIHASVLCSIHLLGHGSQGVGDPCVQVGESLQHEAADVVTVGGATAAVLGVQQLRQLFDLKEEPVMQRSVVE